MSKIYTPVKSLNPQADFSSFSSINFQSHANLLQTNNTFQFLDDNSCVINSLNTQETHSDCHSIHSINKSQEAKVKQIQSNISYDVNTCPHFHKKQISNQAKLNNSSQNCIFEPSCEYYKIFESQNTNQTFEYKLDDVQLYKENATQITKILDLKERPSSMPIDKDSLDLKFEGTKDISQEMFALIKAHTPEYVYSNIFQLSKRKSFFGIKKNFKEIMTYQDSSITSNSLIDLNNISESQQAVRHFCVLFHQMCLKKDIDCVVFDEKDLKDKKKIELIEKEKNMKKIVIQYLLQFGENKPESFINEIYTQVLKQIRNNVQQVQLFDLLNYLKCLLFCFCPSDKILLCLLNVLLIEFPKQQTWQDMSPVLKQINAVIPAILRRFQDDKYKCKNAISVSTLSKLYIDLIINNKQLVFPIFFSTGSIIIVHIEQYETIYDLKTKVLEQLKIESTRFNEDQFVIYDVEKFENNLTRKIALDYEYVWDIMLEWDYIRNKKKMQGNDDYFQFLMIKSIVPFQMTEADQIAIKLNFIQIFYDIYTIYTEYFPDINKLAKIYAFLQNIVKSPSIDQELPIFFTQHQKDQILPMIKSTYQTIKNNYDQLQSKYSFANICKTSIYYDATEISAEYCYNSAKQHYQQSSLVFKPTLFIIFNQDQQTYRQYYYKDIKQIAHKDQVNTIITMKDETVHLIKSEKSFQVEYIIMKYQQLFSKNNLIPIKLDSGQLQKQLTI
ncbi:hypothetical protein ABPG72_001507 [Tetrahymena utriculariae]